MNRYQIGLIVLSSCSVLFSILFFVVGILGIITGATIDVADVTGPNGEIFIDGNSILIALSLLITFSGVIYLVVGMTGIQGSINPARIRAFSTLATIGLILTILELLVSFFQGSVQTLGDWIGMAVIIVVTIVALRLASRIREIELV